MPSTTLPTLASGRMPATFRPAMRTSFGWLNSAAAPVYVLALTSKTISSAAIYDVADTVLAQRISQVPGVGNVTIMHRSGVVSLISLLFAAKNSDQERLSRRIPAISLVSTCEITAKLFADNPLLFVVTGFNNEHME